MSRLFVIAALIGAAVAPTAAVAADAPYYRPVPAHFRPAAVDYRPLPAVSGTLHGSRYGLYGDRSYGPVRYRMAGPAVYEMRRPHVFHRGYAYGYVPGSTFPYGGYPQSSPPVEADAGPASYTGQGFAPAYASPGYGPVAYDQVSRPCGGGCGGGLFGYNAGLGGLGGGLGVFSQGGYGPGPRIIAVPEHYNVGYAYGGHSGCGCGSSGLFGSFGGGSAY